MSLTPVLRRVFVAAAALGSLTPGVWSGAPPVPAAGPGAATGSSASAVPRVDAAAVRRTWSWPLTPRPPVLAPYVAPQSTYGSGHRGLDLTAGQGQPVRAVDAGVVTHVGVIAGRGTVSVTHASGLRSTYEPVAGVVRQGEEVDRGQAIGTVLGRSHCGGSCLHLGALVGSGYVDPRPLLGGGPVILLPLARRP